MVKCIQCPDPPAVSDNNLVAAVCATLNGLKAVGPSCSATDVTMERYVNVSFMQNSSFCALAPALIQFGLATELVCCDQDLCNGPPPLQSQPQSSSTLQCYNGIDDTATLLPITSSRSSIAPEIMNGDNSIRLLRITSCPLSHKRPICNFVSPHLCRSAHDAALALRVRNESTDFDVPSSTEHSACGVGMHTRAHNF